MDSKLFDALVRSLGKGHSRRGMTRLLGGLAFGGPIVFLSLTESVAKRKDGKKRTKKKIAICHNGQTLRIRKSRWGKHKKHGDTVGACSPSSQPSPVILTCPGLGQSCTAGQGTPCCPDIDPNVECAGWFSRRCQDCRQAPSAEGVLCKASPGNQCCGGSAGCYVGVRVQDRSLVCVTTGICVSDPGCTHDFTAGGCPVGERCCSGDRPVCIENDPDGPCCPTTRGGTLCNPLCPGD
jgi:hypothetical protein